MELKFLLCCQQMYRDLHADSRGKQSPHHERVKEHEPVAWDAEHQQLGTLCGGAEGRKHGEQSLLPAFCTLVTQPRARTCFANSVDPHNNINCRVSICKAFRLVANPGGFVVIMGLSDFPGLFSYPIPRLYHFYPQSRFEWPKGFGVGGLGEGKLGAERQWI